MNKINYFVSSKLWLSLEDYYNAGLKPEEVKKIIESLCDPGTTEFGNDPEKHKLIIYQIRYELDLLLGHRGTRFFGDMPQ